MDALSSLERDFINRYQGGFPLIEEPFSEVAGELDTTSGQLLETVTDLRQRGTLSRFGPLFDADRLGGGLSLAALSVPPERYDEVTAIVNALPEIAHNYRRDHPLNMWFVIATDRPEGVRQTLDRIHADSGLEVLNFPKLQEFYLGLWLHLNEAGGVTTVPARQATEHDTPTPLDQLDRRLIALTQAGLPLQERPYAAIADEAGCSEDTVIARLHAMLQGGIIRRIGAVPNHYRLGLKANGMSVWAVPDRDIATLGARIGRLDFVSHCYERPRHPPIWPYNLFAMVHGHDRDEVHAKVAHIADLLGDQCDDHQVLFSSAVLKKTGLRLPS
jgi:DNA-binding Lrp family transcriptional regulator